MTFLLLFSYDIYSTAAAVDVHLKSLPRLPPPQKLICSAFCSVPVSSRSPRFFPYPYSSVIVLRPLDWQSGCSAQQPWLLIATLDTHTFLSNIDIRVVAARYSTFPLLMRRIRANKLNPLLSPSALPSPTLESAAPHRDRGWILLDLGSAIPGNLVVRPPGPFRTFAPVLDTRTHSPYNTPPYLLVYD